MWSSQWDDWQGAIDDAKDIGDEDTVDDLVDDEGLHFQTISESLGACAVSCAGYSGTPLGGHQ